LDDPHLKALSLTTGEFIRRALTGAPPCWLTLMGNSGIGKTHCAERAWNYLRKKFDWTGTAYQPEKIYWPAFLNGLRPPGENEEMFGDVINWPIVFIDDIFAEKLDSPFSQEQLTILLTQRENKWTIITSNKRKSEIAKIQTRISDRIMRSPNLWVEIETISYAVRKK
jgi:DNA replication protein DnaC